ATFDIVFPTDGEEKAGIDNLSSLIDAAVQFGSIDKAGSWYKKKDGTQLAQGKEGLRAVLAEDAKLRKEVLGEVKKKAGIK
ncbi:MAG TPA: hypothetical protein VGA67_03125, partial [Candidatus Dojkabacteria bacterium]